MCLFYRWSHNGTSCEAGLGEVQPTRSTSFPAWKSCASSQWLGQGVGFHMSNHIWSHVVQELWWCCHDATDDDMWGSCISCRRHWWRKLVGTFLNGSILKDRCDKCGSPIFRHSAATECGVDDQGLTGAILSYSWSCQQLLVWNNKTITNNI